MPHPAQDPIPEVLVSIINYRTADLTISCIKSVLADLDGTNGQVVVVDNLSGDGSAEEIEAWMATLPKSSPVRLLRSATNSGFSGGHNQGITAMKAGYYLVLNSDALIRPGFFQAILEAAAKHPDAGFIAPRLEYENGQRQTSCFRFPGPASELIRGAQSGPVTRFLKRRDVPLVMPPEPDQIDWASFACILLNGRMLDQIGLMDEGYFLYFEDVAYCWTARQAGWRIHYSSKAQAIHLRGGSGPVKARQHDLGRLPAYYYASRTRVLYQLHGWVGLFLANFCWVFGRGIANLRRFIGKSVPQASQAEMRDIWINVLAPLGDKRAEGN